jgi:polysaccharide biosynthesis protein PslG
MATTTVNRQVRGFAIVWTLITIIIGVTAFFAIYLTYGDGSPNIFGSSVALPAATTEVPAAAINPTDTATPVPVQALPATATPTEPPAEEEDATEAEERTGAEIAQAVAQAQQEPEPTATLLPINDTDFAVGIQVQQSITLDQEIQNMWMNDVQDLGLNWIKQQVRWYSFEPEKGQYDWGITDLVLPIAAERNIKVLLSIVAAPDWAREPGVDLTLEGPPANNQDFIDFVTALLERYPGQIHAIEVWNEQNIDREWGSTQGLSAPNYVALLRDTYQAIKEIDPGIIVVSGALSPTGGLGDRAINDFDFMDALISAGMLNYTDCVGAHHNGYNIGPSITWDNVPPDPDAVFRGPFDNPHHSWSFRSTLQTYANKVAVAGGDQRLCVTEFGWPTVEDLDGYPENFEFALDNSLQDQAEYTVEAINNMEEWDIVWLAFIWNLNYAPQAGWSTESDNTPYSFIGPDWARRPVYDAVQAWSAERQGREQQ